MKQAHTTDLADVKTDTGRVDFPCFKIYLDSQGLKKTCVIRVQPNIYPVHIKNKLRTATNLPIIAKKRKPLSSFSF